MQTCGIVAEYNLWHRGHSAQLDLVRQKLGTKTAVVVAMSGAVTQRGELSFLTLDARISTALKSGVDLILELPATVSLQASEGFAQNAVRLLGASGIVRNLTYGMEIPEKQILLREIASFLVTESDDFRHELKTEIASGKGYASARAQAIATVFNLPELTTLLRQSNTILALEYEKALLQNNIHIPTFALPLHDKTKFSASNIRRLVKSAQSPTKLEDTLEALHKIMPPAALAPLSHALTTDKNLFPTCKIAQLFYSLPAMYDARELHMFMGMQNGLSRRIFNEFNSRSELLNSQNWDDFINSLATRAFPAARVRRALLSALIGIKREDATVTPQYLRVLGFSKRGQYLLKMMKDNATLPIITRRSDWKKLSPTAKRQLDLSLRAENLLSSLGETSADAGNRSPLQLTAKY